MDEFDDQVRTHLAGDKVNLGRAFGTLADSILNEMGVRSKDAKVALLNRAWRDLPRYERSGRPAFNFFTIGMLEELKGVEHG